MTQITVQAAWELTSCHYARVLNHAILQFLPTGGASTGWLVAAYVVGCGAPDWFVVTYSGGGALCWGAGALCWGAGAGVTAPAY